MRTVQDYKLAMRPTQDDLRHLDIIAAALRSAGQPFVTRSDALRHALRVVASAVSAAPVHPKASPR